MSDEAVPEDLPSETPQDSADRPFDIPLPQGLSEFENGLFREGGPLTFNLEESLKRVQASLQRTEEWITHTNTEKQRAKEIVEDETLRLTHQLLWEERFSGQVPQRWTDQWKAETDLEKAIASGQQLSEPLMNALILHPSIHLAEVVAKGYKLNEDQLAWVLARFEKLDRPDTVTIKTSRPIPMSKYDMMAGTGANFLSFPAEQTDVYSKIIEAQRSKYLFGAGVIKRAEAKANEYKQKAQDTTISDIQTLARIKEQYPDLNLVFEKLRLEEIPADLWKTQ